MGRPQQTSSRPGFAWTAFPAWFLALYRQPAAFLVTVIGIPLLGICLWLYAENERQWRAREGEDLLVAARLAARIIDEELTQTRQIEEALIARPPFVEAVRHSDRRALETLLQFLLDVTPMIDRVMVTQPDGTILGSAGAAPADSRPSDPAPPPLPRQEPVSGVYLRDQASGEKAVAVSTPIRADDATLGALRVQYRLQDISRWLDKVRIEPAGFVYVVDQRGFLVSYPFQLIPGQPKKVLRWAPVAAQASARGAVIRFRQGRPSRPWTAAVVSIAPFGWRVIAQQPDAAMLRPFHQLVASFVLLIGLLAGILSLLVLRWASLHQATLRLLAQQTRLLKQHQQRDVASRIRRAGPDKPRPRDGT